MSGVQTNRTAITLPTDVSQEIIQKTQAVDSNVSPFVSGIAPTIYQLNCRPIE